MKTRTIATLTLMTAVILCLCASIAAAQNKPNFSGAWKLNLEKSKFGALEGVSNMEVKIDHADPSFSESITLTSGAGDRIFEGKYTTDGKESDVKLPVGAAMAIAKWEGDALIVEWKNEGGFHLRRKYIISADGKTLTVRSRNPSQQDEDSDIIVLEKR